MGAGRETEGIHSREAAANVNTWEVLKRVWGKTTEPERAKDVTIAADVLSAFLINFLWKPLLGLLFCKLLVIQLWRT